MRQRSSSFENRWTSGEVARHWVLRLEREGIENVRAIYADHEAHHSDDRLLFEDIPVGFARDWLEWQNGRRRRRMSLRYRALGVFLIVVIVLLLWGGRDVLSIAGQ